MKTKLLAVILLLITIVIMLVWLGSRKHQTESTVAKSNDVPLAQNGPNVRRTNSVKGASQPVAANPAAAATDQAPASALSNAMQNRIAQIQRPIVFYGKVVDEKSQPVAGANVDLTWTQFYPENSFTTNFLTDSGGLFSLQNVTGAGLSVSVSKTGYYILNSLNQVNFRYSALPGTEPFHPDISNPILFHLRKKGQGATLITSQHGMSPVLEFSIPGNGSSVRVDFLNRTAGNEGQMELSAIKPPKTAERGPKAWSFRMTIPDGGFIEENDELAVEAPSSGYAPTIEFNFKPGDTNWTDVIGKHYYIEFGQPPKYGRIDIGTGIYRGVQLGYAINPTGSTDLEGTDVPPPRKQLPPGVTEVIPKQTQ